MKPRQPYTIGRGPSRDIHARLRDRICLLEYRPGDILRETELATEFGVSRTPVREALQRLAVEGLVEIRNGVGTMVTRLEFDELQEIYRVRTEMALMLGRMGVTPWTHADTQALEALLSRTQELSDSFDVCEYWDINHQLHLAVSKLILNSTFREIWDNLYFKAARIWYDTARTMQADALDLLVREISDLIIAARENDPDAIGCIKRNYISYSWRRVLNRMEPARTR